MGQTASYPISTDTTPEELASGSKRVTPRHNRKNIRSLTVHNSKRGCNLCSSYHGDVAASLPRIESTRSSRLSTSSQQVPLQAAPEDSTPVRDKRRRRKLRMNVLPKMQTPEAATKLIRRRDKAVFEVQSALQMLGKYDTGNEMDLIHLGSKDLQRLEDGLGRVGNLLESVSAHIEPFDRKLAAKFLAYQTIIMFNTAGFSELGKTRAMLQRVGKDLKKIKTYTSQRDVEASTKVLQHGRKNASSTPPLVPRTDVGINPWSTQDDAALNTTNTGELQSPTIWRTAGSACFSGPPKSIAHSLKHRSNTIETIHTATHSTISYASGQKSSKETGKASKEKSVGFQAFTLDGTLTSLGKDEKEKGRADNENARVDLNQSSLNFDTPSKARSPPLVSIHTRSQTFTEKRNAWRSSLASPSWQEIMEGGNPAQGRQELQTGPVAEFSLTVLPAATDEASYMQLSNVDIIEFAVVDADRCPVTGFTWITSAPAGSLKTHDAGCTTTVRNHAAAKLKADPRAICLWFTTVPIESNGYGSGDTVTLSKQRVNVFLDPYVRLIVGNTMHTVDYSKRVTAEKIPVNRACVTVRDLRKRAQTQLSIHKKQRFNLIFQGITLGNDKAELRNECSLNQRILQGWEPLYITVEIEKRRDCVVCGDELSLSRFSHRPITATCSHECNTCRKCVREWIKSSLNNNGPEKLTCTECPAVLQHADVKAHASSRQFERYDNFLTRSVVNADPDFHWCITTTCTSGHSHISITSGPIFTCPACNLRQCVHHKIPWHIGETCEAYDYRISSTARWKEEEEASQKTIKETTRPCPKCKASIEKNDGCDHMTCRKCKHEFCWVCMVDYEPIRRQGNSMHNVMCSHYRGMDDFRPPLPPLPPPMARRR